MKKTTQRKKQLDIRFETGFVVNGKYEILEEIGRGFEGRVYLVRELGTNIERTIKFFYPEQNKGGKIIKAVAKKLHALRTSRILIQYHTQDTVVLSGGQTVSFLVSEFTEGVILSEFLKQEPGQRLHYFAGLHLLHDLVKGVEEIHRQGQYHGDIHTANIMIERAGLSFGLKLLDPFHWVGATKRDGQQDDIVGVIEVFFEAVGGQEHYARLPQVVKDICLGMKKPFILRKFKTMSRLRAHLETLEW